jgi:hypothetical protein
MTYRSIFDDVFNRLNLSLFLDTFQKLNCKIVIYNNHHEHLSDTMLLSAYWMLLSQRFSLFHCDVSKGM